MSEHMQVKETLQDGETYAGVILGKDGQPDQHLVLLAGEAHEVSWTAAREWASGVGGDLPNRRELALLFANCREQFSRAWYWSSEPQEPRAQLVWGQNFTSGIQTMYGRPFRGHARAVRRLAIE
ncbi:DUF1566 domain-containing protein [Massilia sp. CF038]|uniref:DUF1566 domain-containing protein n=1 Tax=Massilia sp. CF038 TaxID=1881045 RepID=UPI00091C695D|nr:DUF1566 domain-containing protein [Massilia sp. CF038]SHG98692.1 hypothetical protein SAMN05428948_2192 [Massilia sp. CF038]